MTEKEYLEDLSQRIKEKERAAARRGRHKIPYSAREGVFDDQTENICWWTNGFWGGILWQLFHATGEELYREAALEVEEKLDKNLMLHWGMDHDSGFKWLPTAVARFRLFGEESARNRGLLAAANLAGRFNPAGCFIRAWNDEGDGHTAGWAIIDCMMNLPLLYWAYEQTKDPRFYHIAVRHADTAAAHFIRPDGSARHIVEFDPMTGAFVRSHGGQGCGEGSSWTRGQAWALYGFALSYRHTQDPRYMEVSRRVADHFLSHIPASGRIPVDFDQPEGCTLEDSTAAAIAACGLLELAGHLGEERGALYRRGALSLIRTLDRERCCWDSSRDELLEKCTAAFHDERHEFPIIYGDYFFIEAVWKLTGQELFIW